MPAGSFLALIDQIMLMSKAALKQTAGVVGDDLALNSQQVQGQGVDPCREIPIVMAVAKGSLINKAILTPAAMGISALAPAAIPPLLMVGGAYLCYEGFEKIVHHPDKKEEDEAIAAMAVATPLSEKDRIRGAVRTDFVLSSEIMTLTLGSVAGAALLSQLGVMVAVGVGMTALVYGAVAGIVKLDDLGLHWAKKEGKGLHSRAFQKAGRAILKAAPHFLKGLAITGTAAMFTVGGGIILHGLPVVGPWVHEALGRVGEIPSIGGLAEGAGSLLAYGLSGVAAGAIALGASKPATWLYGKARDAMKSKPSPSPEKSPEILPPVPGPVVTLRNEIRSDVSLKEALEQAAAPASEAPPQARRNPDISAPRP